MRSSIRVSMFPPRAPRRSSPTFLCVPNWLSPPSIPHCCLLKQRCPVRLIFDMLFLRPALPHREVPHHRLHFGTLSGKVSSQIRQQLFLNFSVRSIEQRVSDFRLRGPLSAGPYQQLRARYWHVWSGWVWGSVLFPLSYIMGLKMAAVVHDIVFTPVPFDGLSSIRAGSHWTVDKEREGVSICNRDRQDWKAGGIHETRVCVGQRFHHFWWPTDVTFSATGFIMTSAYLCPTSFKYLEIRSILVRAPF